VVLHAADLQGKRIFDRRGQEKRGKEEKREGLGGGW